MEKYVPLVTKQCVRKILPDEIVYIMKKARKIMLVTDKEVYEYYGKLEPVSQVLDRRFFACLRGCIINLDKVLRMEDQRIYMTNGEPILMGRDNFIRAKQYYTAYLKKLL